MEPRQTDPQRAVDLAVAEMFLELTRDPRSEPRPDDGPAPAQASDD